MRHHTQSIRRSLVNACRAIFYRSAFSTVLLRNRLGLRPHTRFECGTRCQFFLLFPFFPAHFSVASVFPLSPLPSLLSSTHTHFGVSAFLSAICLYQLSPLSSVPPARSYVLNGCDVAAHPVLRILLHGGGGEFRGVGDVHRRHIIVWWGFM